MELKNVGFLLNKIILSSSEPVWWFVPFTLFIRNTVHFLYSFFLSKGPLFPSLNCILLAYVHASNWIYAYM
jgi:hypothetical protein